jgi:hypothetical protein
MNFFRCAPSTRPATPLEFGQDCGLVQHSQSPATHDRLVPGIACELCHTRFDPDENCLRQACTMRCHYDEDCPDGTVCLCMVQYGMYVGRFCARALDRFTLDGRTAWLNCP